MVFTPDVVFRRRFYIALYRYAAVFRLMADNFESALRRTLISDAAALRFALTFFIFSG